MAGGVHDARTSSPTNTTLHNRPIITATYHSRATTDSQGPRGTTVNGHYYSYWSTHCQSVLRVWVVRLIPSDPPGLLSVFFFVLLLLLGSRQRRQALIRRGLVAC